MCNVASSNNLKNKTIDNNNNNITICNFYFYQGSDGTPGHRAMGRVSDQAVLRPAIDRALRVMISVTLLMKYPSD